MNPYVLIGALLALIAAGLTGARIGMKVERAGWQEKEIRQLAAATQRVAELNDAARATERAHVERAAQLEADLVKERIAHEALKRRDRAAALDGSLRLRVPASVCADRGSLAEARAAASGGDGPATVELPPAIGANLYDLANDADQVADELRACQALVLSDRNPGDRAP